MLRGSSEKEITIFVQDTWLGIPDDPAAFIPKKFLGVREHESCVGWHRLGFPFQAKLFMAGGRIEVKSKIAWNGILGVSASFWQNAYLV